MQAKAPPTRAVRFLCSEYDAGKLAVLDVGCGRGDHLAYFGPGSLGLDAVEAKFRELAAGLESKKVKPSKSDALSRNAANSIGLHRQTGGASQLKLGN